MGHLPDSYRVPVRAEGIAPCRIAFVGGSPNWKDVHHMRPFMAESGRILDACMRAANIDRATCYVGNVFDTMLYNDDLNSHVAYVGREAFADQQTEAALRLNAELEIAKPNVVCALGNVALGALCNVAQVSRLRGSARMGEGWASRLKVFPTYHPMHVSKNYKFLAVAMGDFIRLSAEAETPTVRQVERELIVTPSIAQVESYLFGPEVTGAGLLSCDIETCPAYGQVRGISFAASRHKGIYVPFVSFGTLSRSYWSSAAEEKRAWVACKRTLESRTPKLGQNFGNYDAVWLLSKMGIRVRNYTHDLRLLHKAIYPELPASLEFMANSYSEQGAWKSFASHAGMRRKDIDVKRDA